jgi:NAD(P)-dependent dehydrogenase (short-subunit alcohol dehydrogenase family)
VGALDILGNTAGIFSMAGTAQSDEAIFDEVIATNVNVPFYLTARISAHQ